LVTVPLPACFDAKRGANYMARSLQWLDVGQESPEEKMMNARDANLAMLKMLSATIGYSLGIGVTFSSAIIAIVTLLQ
jgi:hypothetical protein